MSHRKCLLIANRGDGPKTLVKSADRVIVEGLPLGEGISIIVDDGRVLDITGVGVLPLTIRNQMVQVKRVAGRTPVTVFLERD